MAGIYDYINQFWAEAERSPFNPTEVALYHYLLYEANRLRWNMPFACHTAILCVRLSTTKQNISKARQHLKERGLIDCQVGTGIHTPALYSLTIQPSRQLPHQITRQLTHELTVQLPHSNIKDKDEDIINSQHAREDGHNHWMSLSHSCLPIRFGRTRLSKCWRKEKTGLLTDTGYTGISVTSLTSKESAETRSGTRAIAEAIFTIGLSNI